MLRLDWSLSRLVTQDIKTQPQINRYQITFLHLPVYWSVLFMSIGWNYYTPVSKGDLYIPCLLSYQSLPDNQGYQRYLILGVTYSQRYHQYPPIGGIRYLLVGGLLDKGILL